MYRSLLNVTKITGLKNTLSKRSTISGKKPDGLVDEVTVVVLRVDWCEEKLEQE